MVLHSSSSATFRTLTACSLSVFSKLTSGERSTVFSRCQEVGGSVQILKSARSLPLKQTPRRRAEVRMPAILEWAKLDKEDLDQEKVTLGIQQAWRAKHED